MEQEQLAQRRRRRFVWKWRHFLTQLEYIIDRYLYWFRPLTNFDEETVRDKVVLITGASAGIGKLTAMKFAERGAKVIMACRNMEKGRAVLEEIKEQTGSRKIDLMELELTDFNSVRKFATAVKEKYPEIHIIINNAGMSNDTRELERLPNGFELHMTANHLGHFLLINLLIDCLKNGAPSRVVVVSSSAQYYSSLDLDDLMLERHPNPTEHYGVVTLPYANSKFANSLFAKELGKRLEGSGVTTYSICPGVVATEVFRNYTRFGLFIAKWTLRLTGSSVDEASDNIIYCALSKRVSDETGKFYRFFRSKPSANTRLKPELCRKLWDISANLVQLKVNEGIK